MRVLILALTILLTCFVSVVWARPLPFHAGVARITVSADEPFDVFVWYPTQAEEVAWQVGPFPIRATRDAAVANGAFPVLLMSHGGGKTGGSPLLLRDLSISLARQGFIVVAPMHGKSRFLTRIFQVDEAFKTVVADQRFNKHAAADKLGMIGFSLGGAVSLGLAGGKPDFVQLADYCAAHTDDILSCSGGPGGDKSDAASKQAGPVSKIPHLSLKALVLLDPFSVLFNRDGLKEVRMPVFLFRPKHSLLGEDNTRGLIADLPVSPPLQYVRGGHFVFTDICPRLLCQRLRTCVRTRRALIGLPFTRRLRRKSGRFS